MLLWAIFVLYILKPFSLPKQANLNRVHKVSHAHLFRYHVSLSETDHAGVVHFSHFFSRMHCSYEEFLRKKKISLRLFWEEGIAFPIVHSKVDFSAPLSWEEEAQLSMHVSHLTDRSFSLHFLFTSLTFQRECALGKSIHVAIDSHSREKKSLPPSLCSALQTLYR